MDRISTYGASQLMISRILQTQTRMQQEQLQSTTGYRTEEYSGIALDARTAINLENQNALIDSYLSSNASVTVRQNTVNTALTSARTSIDTLKNRLVSFSSGQMSDQTAVRDVQDLAIRTLTELQATLNTSVDGEYLFSGGRKDTMPVDFATTDLATFQKLYTGSTTTYPTLRGANLLDIHLTNRDTGTVSFDSSSGLIMPAQADGYVKVTAGALVQISGSDHNNGTVTVRGHAVTNAGRSPLVETSNSGAGTYLTTVGTSPSVLTTATTGALSFAYDPSGQLVMSPKTPNTLSTLVPGTRFSISGSDAAVGFDSSTALIGTNYYTYADGATAATGIHITDRDQLTLDFGAETATFTPGTTGTSLDDLVGWIDSRTDMDGNRVAEASLDNQGRLVITNISAAPGKTVKASGALAGLLGVAGSTATTGNRITGSAELMTDVLPQTLVSLTNPATGAPLFAAGETLTMAVGGGAAATFTVSATSTLTDVARFIQDQNPTTLNANGTVAAMGAEVSFSNGRLTVTNHNGGGNAYTFGGTVATTLGITGAVADGGTVTTPLASRLTSVAGTYDGAYLVTGYDIRTGAVTLANDTTATAEETISANQLKLWSGGATPTAVATGLTTGSATFTLSGDTLTLTVPAGVTPALNTSFNPGDPITIGGTANHNGTYQVASVTGTTVSVKVNADMLRVAPFLAQSGRNDVTMSFPTTVTPDQGTTTSTAAPGTIRSGTATLDRGEFGTLSFTSAGEIIASRQGAFLDSGGLAYPPVGTVIKLGSDSGVNDGVYTVTANDGTTLRIGAKVLTAETGVARAEMTSDSWYKGDTLGLNTHINQTATIDTAISASDSAFEKAIRACGIIAQGSYGTAGGLDQHPERIEAAIALLKDALEHSSTATLPYGPEEASDIDGLQKRVGLNLSAINTSNTTLKQMKSFFETRITDIEQISPTEAITAFLMSSQALQASYSALSQVSQMSLINFLK